MFPQQFNSPEWQSRIHAIVPSYGQKLNGNVALTQQVWDDTAATLQLTKPPVIQMPAAAPTATAKPAERRARPRRSTIWRCKSKLDSEQREDHGLPFLRYLPAEAARCLQLWRHKRYTDLN